MCVWTATVESFVQYLFGANIITYCVLPTNFKKMSSLEEILPTKLYEVLERNNICTPKQIIILSVWDIKKITNLSNENILLVKDIVNNNWKPICTPCNKLMTQEKNKKVTTGCKVIDYTLKGGFRRGTITEIYGESGSGKTQVGIQAAAYNWNDGSVYICTEDLFPVKRYEQIKNNLPDYCPKIDYGKNIFIEHITESQDLLSCIQNRLPVLLSKNKLSLLVLDSVAAPFRVENTNYVQRAEELRELAMTLLKIAQEHNMAIVCINQVTAAFCESVDILPALGLAWSNMISTRLWLRKTKQTCSLTDNNEVGPNTFLRELLIDFSPELPNSRTKCIITSSGIKGI